MAEFPDRFYLETYQNGELFRREQVEPTEWNDFGYNFTRDDVYLSVFKQPTAKDVTLNRTAKGLILEAYDNDGINADIYLDWESIKTTGTTVDYELKARYRVELEDLNLDLTYGTGDTVNVKLSEENPYLKLKKRDGQKLPFSSTESVEGVLLTAKTRKSVKFNQRSIRNRSEFSAPLQSTFEIPNPQNGLVGYVPLFSTKNSIAEIQTPEFTDIDQTDAIPETANLLYTYSRRDSQLTITGGFTVSFRWISSIDDNAVFNNVFSVYLQKVNEQGEELEKELKFSLTTSRAQFLIDNGGDRGDFKINVPEVKDLLRGEGLSYRIEVFDTSVADINNNDFSYHFEGETDLVYVQDSLYEDTNVEMSLAFEVMQSLAEQITDTPGVFVSNALGRTDIGYPVDGPASLVGFCNGFDLRQATDIDNEKKDLILSFKNAFEALDRCFGLCMFTKNGKIHIELAESAFKDEMNGTITIEELSNKVDSQYYNIIQVGSKKIEYEDAEGLDEPNTEIEYNTPARVKKTAKYRNPIQTDYSGAERARRIQFSLDASDTKYDSKIWIISLVRDGLEYETKVGFNGYDLIENIYSPETLGNLDFTPQRSIEALKYRIGNSMYNISGNITPQNSENLAKLRSRKTGGQIVDESQPTALIRPNFKPETLKVKGAVTDVTDFDGFFDSVWQGLKYEGYLKDVKIIDNKIEGELIRR